MNIDQIPASGSTTVACECGHEVQIVDRYITDWPPIPRGRPEAFVEFYTVGSNGDPDDRLSECPGCGEYLDLQTVTERELND